MDLEITSILDETLSEAWNREDGRFELPAGDDRPGMMRASVTVDDETVQVIEFDGWLVIAEYRFSGVPGVYGTRLMRVLEAIETEPAL